MIVVGVVVVGRCDNSGISFNWHFSVKPIKSCYGASSNDRTSYTLDEMVGKGRGESFLDYFK